MRALQHAFGNHQPWRGSGIRRGDPQRRRAGGHRIATLQIRAEPTIVFMLLVVRAR
jgi:hypothetical protein